MILYDRKQENFSIHRSHIVDQKRARCPKIDLKSNFVTKYRATNTKKERKALVPRYLPNYQRARLCSLGGRAALLPPQDCWSHVRRDSGASTQHSTERDRSRRSSSYNNGTPPPAIVRHYSPDNTDSSNSQTDYSPTCNSR